MIFFFYLFLSLSCFSVSFSASKTVLNGMLKEPSLIPDQILAKNVYQVSVLNFSIHIVGNHWFCFYLFQFNLIYFYKFCCPAKSTVYCMYNGFLSDIVPPCWQTASAAHVFWWGHVRAGGHACQSASISCVFTVWASFPRLPSTHPPFSHAIIFLPTLFSAL